MTDTTLDQSTWLDDDATRDQLPRRARRKLVTPVTAGLVAVIIAAAGFVGGVETQKSSATASTGATGAGAGARPAGFGGGPPGAAGGQSAGSGASGSVTTGQVKSKDGSTLYVTNADGTTVKVKTTSTSKVSRNASSSAAAIQPGDTVVIQGTTAANGTFDATSVSATASGVAPTGGFFPGGRPGGGAATPGSTTSNGGTP
jgi:hypothetical protein